MGELNYSEADSPASVHNAHRNTDGKGINDFLYALYRNTSERISLLLRPFALILGLMLMNIPASPLHASSAHSEKEHLLTDFSATSADLGWYLLNDNVMGGRSDGHFQQEQGELTFAGRTNTNGGGFSSIRTNPLQLDLSSHAGIRLKVRGDGRRYTWRLTTDARWRGRQVSYWADFATVSDAWTTVDIPFSRFIPRVRGYQLDGPALEPGQITGMGLMIYDKQDGPFEIQMARVCAYKEERFVLAQYQWKNRVLVISASTEDDKNLQRQRDLIGLMPEQFTDNDLVLVTLLDNAISRAGERELTTEEVDAARAALEISPGLFTLKLIGKDGSVKMSDDKAIPMTEIYDLINSMPMRQSELSARQ